MGVFIFAIKPLSRSAQAIDSCASMPKPPFIVIPLGDGGLHFYYFSLWPLMIFSPLI